MVKSQQTVVFTSDLVNILPNLKVPLGNLVFLVIIYFVLKTC